MRDPVQIQVLFLEEIHVLDQRYGLVFAFGTPIARITFRIIRIRGPPIRVMLSRGTYVERVSEKAQINIYLGSG